MAIDTNDFAELDALLGQAMADVKDAEKTKEARERLKRGGLSAEERAADAARIADWERKHEWRAVSNVALFLETGCAHCNTVSMAFSHYMQKQEHRHLRNSFRWQTTTEIKTDLPNEVVVQTKFTAMCEDCAPSRGWPMDNATTWEG